MIEEYKKFKDSLAALCERGVIRKETKKKFGAFDGEEKHGELIHSVCGELNILFGESASNSKEYRAMCSSVIELLISLEAYYSGFEHEFAVVGAYIKLTEQANATMTSSAFQKMSAHLEEYNKSLQNIKYGLRLF